MQHRRSLVFTFNRISTAMNKLIRHRATRAFLTKDGGWTHQPRKARALTGIHEAMALRDHLKLSNIELYYCTGDQPDPLSDFSVPIRDHTARPQTSGPVIEQHPDI